jgi:hypothetical protein
MKKITRFATIWAIVACAVMASASAFAQSLWHGTTFGMTVDQVQAAVPEAAPATNKSPGNGVRFNSQFAPELLQVDDVQLVSEVIGPLPQIAPKKLWVASLWQSGIRRCGRPVWQWCVMPACERGPG